MTFNQVSSKVAFTSGSNILNNAMKPTLSTEFLTENQEKLNLTGGFGSWL